MPHDFGSFGSRDHQLGQPSGSGPGIGFHELRQACEISTLREDLERLAHEAGQLRDRVEEAVEQVRDRFAGLSAAELSNAESMAPLLQFAVATLLDIREQARCLDTRTGPVADDDRPSWLGAADAPRVRPTPAVGPTEPAASVPSVSPTPAEPAASPPFSDAPSPMAPSIPSAPSAAGPMRDRPVREPQPSFPASHAPPTSPSAASWLTSNGNAAPLPPSRAAAARSGGPAMPAPGGIDWLGPAGR